MCTAGDDQWCMPIEYRCNDVRNCPDGEDEGDICTTPREYQLINLIDLVDSMFIQLNSRHLYNVYN